MPNIRISKTDKAEYQKLMRNAKAKMKRLQKQGIDLTGEIELPPLSAFENRKQFNEWKDFTNKFNKGLKKEYKVYTTENGAKLLGKEIKQLEETNIKAITMAEEHYKNRTPESETVFKKVSNLDIPDKVKWKELPSRKAFQEKLENMQKRSDPDFFTKRDVQFKSNFIKGVMQAFDSFWLSEEVKERLEKIDPNDLLQLFKHEKFSRVFQFEIYYNEDHLLDYLESMNEVLKSYEERGLEGLMDGENDFLLKNFPDKV